VTPGKTAGFVLGLALFLVVGLLPTFDSFTRAATAVAANSGAPVDPATLASSMQCVLALLLLMVVWWFTEAVPLPVTALLPAGLLPFLHASGISGSAVYPFTPANVLRHYASPVIFLFLGGFLIAAAMQKWKLDRRFTLWFLTRGNIAGDSRKILLGMMCATAFLSMWISNTAAAAMMIPIGIGLLSMFEAEPGKSRYGTAVMLGIAWSASIGGVGTIIGSPPNGIALGILGSTFGADPSYHPISFLGWMAFGVPFVGVMIPLTWLLLLRMHPPEIVRLSGERERLLEEYASLGPFSGGEKGTLGVLVTAVVLWVSNPFWRWILPGALGARLGWVDEYSIGIFCGLLLFVIPAGFRGAGFLLSWEDTRFVDWGTLILFGGGIALSDAMFKSGLASWMVAPAVGVFGASSTLLLLVVVVIVMEILTEVTSNTAVTSMMVPVVIGVSAQAGVDPVMLAIGAAVAASMAFMLPVATPPNALVYGSGRVPLRAMIRTGLLLDLAGWLLTTLVVFGLAHLLLGVL
jgi:sodium-dependent dicarboxylate transporter 2/3/5